MSRLTPNGNCYIAALTIITLMSVEDILEAF